MLTRYDPDESYTLGTPSNMVTDSTGDYVKYEDVIKLIKSMRRHKPDNKTSYDDDSLTEYPAMTADESYCWIDVDVLLELVGAA